MGWSRGHLTFQARSGEWWVATAKGEFRFPPLSTAAGLGRARPKGVYAAGESVFAAFEDSRGAIWISTQIPGPNGAVRANSLARWDPSMGVLERYPAGDPVGRGLLATAFAEDRAGNVWIGLNSGALIRYRQGRFQTLPPSGGTWVTDLYADRKGRLWVATTEGAHRIDEPGAAEPRIADYAVADGLSSDQVACITGDLLGRIYLGTGRGVDCIYPGVLPRIRHYTEDEAAVLRLFEAVLAQDGYYVTAVGTGRQALVSAGATAFDVIISDMSLPDMDGTELIRQMRLVFPSCKVLAVSGYMMGSMRAIAIAAGATATLAKPVAPRDLQVAVYHLLDPSCAWLATGEGEGKTIRGRAIGRYGIGEIMGGLQDLIQALQESNGAQAQITGDALYETMAALCRPSICIPPGGGRWTGQTFAEELGLNPEATQEFGRYLGRARSAIRHRNLKAALTECLLAKWIPLRTEWK